MIKPKNQIIKNNKNTQLRKPSLQIANKLNSNLAQVNIIK